MVRKIAALAVMLLCTASLARAAELKMPLLWTIETKTFLESAPTVADIDGDGYCETIAAAREEMIALDRSGKELWRWKSKGRYGTYPAVLARQGQPTLIYAADTAGGVVCLNGSGKAVWQATMKGGAMWAAGVVCDLRHKGAWTVLQTDSDGNVYLFDAVTGKSVWQIAVKGMPVSPAVGDVNGDGVDEIAIACGNGVLYLLDASGKVLWQRSVSGESQSWATSAPVMFGTSEGKGRIAVGGSDSRVTCLDGAGSVVWARETRGSVASTLSVGDMDHDGRADVFAVTQTGVIYRFDEDGRVVWNIDMQGRTIAAGALLDLQNDGHLDFVACTQSGRLFVFNDRGESIFQHVFQNRTINMTPAFGDVTPASPGLEMVITGGESGKVFCFGTPASATAKPEARQWVTYRGDNHKTGAWFGLQQGGGAYMSPRDASWSHIATGDPVLFAISVGETPNLPLKATAVCVRPDGSKQSATTPVYGITGELPLPIDIVMPGSYRFTWSVVDAKGTKLAGGQHAVFLEPFANDRAIVARAQTALTAAADRVATTLPLSAAALRTEALALATETAAVEPLQKAVAGGGGPAEQIAQRRTVPLVKQARRASAIASAIEAARDLGPTASVLPFETTLWDSGGVDTQVPATATGLLSIARRVVPGEHDPASVKLFNITNRELQVRVIVETAKDGPNAVPFRTLVVPTSQGGMAWDPVTELDETLVVTIPSLSTREVWLDTRFDGVKPGEHVVRVRFQALNGAGVLEGPTSSQDVKAPECSAQITYTVLPFQMAADSIFRMCCWANLGPGTIEDLLEHGNNVFCVPAGEPVLDAAGNVTGYDYAKTDKLLVRMRIKDSVALVQGTPALKAKPGTPEHAAGFKTWLLDLKAHMAKMGFDTNHFAMYPFDEPGGNGWASVNGFVEFGKLARAADPSVRIYVDGGAEIPMLEKMRAYVDIWTPGLTQLADPGPEMKFMRDTGKELWSYDCGYVYTSAMRANLKDTNTVAEYRTAALFAMRWNASGIGFWCYNIGGDFWQRVENDYPIVYPGRTKPVSSRRWEAVREGIEDYRIIAALRDLHAKTADAALKQRIGRLIEKSLPAFVDRSTQEVLVGLGRSVYANSKNDATLNTLRAEMLDCVEAACKAGVR